MICPYIPPGSVIVYQKKTDEEAEENYVEITKQVPHKCPQEECAAWHDGRCHYKE